jgi:L-ectoine synthase
MKVINLIDISGTEREVICPKGGFASYRYLLKSDGMGFGLHKTIIPEGPPQRWHYKHHKEACYCVSGFGILTNERTGERHSIKADTCYVLDDNDPHTFQAIHGEVVLVSVFNPPCVGKEVHAEDGSYSIGGEE